MTAYIPYLIALVCIALLVLICAKPVYTSIRTALTPSTPAPVLTLVPAGGKHLKTATREVIVPADQIASYMAANKTLVVSSTPIANGYSVRVWA